MKKTIKIPAITIAASVMLLAGAVPALAAHGTKNNEGPNPLGRIVRGIGQVREQAHKLAGQHRQENTADRRTRLEAKLTKAVQDGKLTDAQKQAILQKYDELATFRQTLQSLTSQQRRAAMQAKHAELLLWAKTNGIPSPFDRIFLMGNGPKHFHR